MRIFPGSILFNFSQFVCLCEFPHVNASHEAAGSEQPFTSFSPDLGVSSPSSKGKVEGVTLSMLKELISVYTSILCVLCCVLYCASKWKING